MPTPQAPKPQAASLLDISGRKVLDLYLSANDARFVGRDFFALPSAVAWTVSLSYP